MSAPIFFAYSISLSYLNCNSNNCLSLSLSAAINCLSLSSCAFSNASCFSFSSSVFPVSFIDFFPSANFWSIANICSLNSFCAVNWLALNSASITLSLESNSFRLISLVFNWFCKEVISNWFVCSAILVCSSNIDFNLVFSSSTICAFSSFTPSSLLWFVCSNISNSALSKSIAFFANVSWSFNSSFSLFNLSCWAFFLLASFSFAMEFIVPKNFNSLACASVSFLILSAFSLLSSARSSRLVSFCICSKVICSIFKSSIDFSLSANSSDNAFALSTAAFLSEADKVVFFAIASCCLIWFNSLALFTICLFSCSSISIPNLTISFCLAMFSCILLPLPANESPIFWALSAIAFPASIVSFANPFNSSLIFWTSSSVPNTCAHANWMSFKPPKNTFLNIVNVLVSNLKAGIALSWSIPTIAEKNPFTGANALLIVSAPFCVDANAAINAPSKTTIAPIPVAINATLNSFKPFVVPFVALATPLKAACFDFKLPITLPTFTPMILMLPLKSFTAFL